MDNRARLIQIGQIIFGNQWQTPMSKLMGISDRTMRRIVAGTSRPPSTERIIDALNEQLHRTKLAIELATELLEENKNNE